MILLWLYMLLLKVKSDNVGDINMDASLIFDTENTDTEEFNVGDLNVGDDLYDDLSEIVITVGELVKMYNDEENDTDKENVNKVTAKKKFKKLESSKSSNKQGQNEITVDFRDVADAGEERRCVEKVVLQEETEWEQEVKCQHRYRQHCYTTYSTAFKPFQEKECQDNYKKNCFIEFGLDAVNHTVRVCRSTQQLLLCFAFNC